MDCPPLNSLIRKIKDDLRNLYPEPWLPGLTIPLVGWGKEELRIRTGITATDYGTERVLTGKIEHPRHEGVGLSNLCAGVGKTCPVTVEFLSASCRGKYHDIGLDFYSAEEVRNSTIIDCLQDAIIVLDRVPTLRSTVLALIRTCHVLKAENDAYDVSYSDPQAPFSAFVSVPPERGAMEALRVAESLVHEAMHLQLTLIERLLPLVKSSNVTFFSPWKGTQRPLRGVLHALYVFRVIDSLFERLLQHYPWPALAAEHMYKRRREIGQQISRVRRLNSYPSLTPDGSCLAISLICGRAS